MRILIGYLSTLVGMRMTKTASFAISLIKVGPSARDVRP